MEKHKGEAAKRRYVCERHPDRIASISTTLKGRCCWECYLPADVFSKRYGPEFYKPGGPGCAGNAGNEERKES